MRLRLFLDSIGFSDLSAKKICKWKPEDRRHFEIIQERYMFLLIKLKYGLMKLNTQTCCLSFFLCGKHKLSERERDGRGDPHAET